MLRKLSKSNVTTWYYKDGDMVPGHPPDAYGIHAGVSGNLTGVSGNLTGVRGELSGVGGNLTRVRGELSGVRGNLSGVFGNLTGVRGNLTGVSGDLDDCKITQEDRKAGIHISELIAADAKESETK